MSLVSMGLCGKEWDMTEQLWNNNKESLSLGDRVGSQE